MVHLRAFGELPRPRQSVPKRIRRSDILTRPSWCHFWDLFGTLGPPAQSDDIAPSASFPLHVLAFPALRRLVSPACPLQCPCISRAFPLNVSSFPCPLPLYFPCSASCPVISLLHHASFLVPFPFMSLAVPCMSLHFPELHRLMSPSGPPYCPCVSLAFPRHFPQISLSFSLYFACISPSFPGISFLHLPLFPIISSTVFHFPLFPFISCSFPFQFPPALFYFPSLQLHFPFFEKNDQSY